VSHIKRPVTVLTGLFEGPSEQKIRPIMGEFSFESSKNELEYGLVNSCALVDAMLELSTEV
jgi:hypothetical protein